MFPNHGQKRAHSAAFGWDGSIHPQFVQPHSASRGFDGIQVPSSYASPQPHALINLTGSAQPMMHVNQQQQQFHRQPQQLAYQSPYTPQQLDYTCLEMQYPRGVPGANSEVDIPDAAVFGGFQGLDPGAVISDVTASGEFQVATPNMHYPAVFYGSQFAPGMPLPDVYQEFLPTNYMAPNTQYVEHPLAQEQPLSSQQSLTNSTPPAIPQRQHARAVRPHPVIPTPEIERTQRGPIAPISKPLGGLQTRKRIDARTPCLRQPISPEFIQQPSIHQRNLLGGPRHLHTRQRRSVRTYSSKSDVMPPRTNISQPATRHHNSAVAPKAAEGVRSLEPVSVDPPETPEALYGPKPTISIVPDLIPPPESATKDLVPPQRPVNHDLVDAMMSPDDFNSTDPTLRIYGAIYPTKQLLETYNMRDLFEELVKEAEECTKRQKAEWEAEKSVQMKNQEDVENKESSM